MGEKTKKSEITTLEQQLAAAKTRVQVDEQKVGQVQEGVDGAVNDANAADTDASKAASDVTAAQGTVIAAATTAGVADVAATALGAQVTGAKEAAERIEADAAAKETELEKQKSDAANAE